MKIPEIIYHDDAICLVAKPSGLAVHKSEMTGRDYTLTDFLYEKFDKAPVPVHRLDKPASGLLLCASSTESSSILNKAFRERRVKKQYLTVVRGWVPDSLTINNPLNRYNNRGKSMGNQLEAQEAETEIINLAKAVQPYPNNRFPTTRFSLVQVSPHTGRYHQIRRHLAGIGYPIVGDTSHGDTRINHLVSEKTNFSRLMLHACLLEFQHPFSGKLMTFHKSPHGEMEEFINLLGWDLSVLINQSRESLTLRG